MSKKSLKTASQSQSQKTADSKSLAESTMPNTGLKQGSEGPAFKQPTQETQNLQASKTAGQEGKQSTSTGTSTKSKGLTATHSGAPGTETPVFTPKEDLTKDKNVIYPETKEDTSRIKELREASRSDLEERYYNEFSKVAPENFTDQELIDAIESSSPYPPAKKLTTKDWEPEDKDHFTVKGRDGKEYKISNVNKGHVNVRQVQVQELNNGMVEVPNTEQIQTYDPVTFERNLKTNFFSESKLKIEILHDPRGSKGADADLGKENRKEKA